MVLLFVRDWTPAQNEWTRHSLKKRNGVCNCPRSPPEQRPRRSLSKCYLHGIPWHLNGISEMEWDVDRCQQWSRKGLLGCWSAHTRVEQLPYNTIGLYTYIICWTSRNLLDHESLHLVVSSDATSWLLMAYLPPKKTSRYRNWRNSPIPVCTKCSFDAEWSQVRPLDLGALICVSDAHFTCRVPGSEWKYS